MKYEIKNKFTGGVKFTAEIDCDESSLHSLKLGLAIKLALKNDADLSGADLSGADLSDADLSDAYLRDADLRGADLRGADLRGADLRNADLRNADLSDAYLRDADLRGADLRDADLRYYKSDIYECYVQKKFLQVGCEKHKWEDWERFKDKEIIAMDGKDALKWWRVNKPILQAIRGSIEVVR